MITDRYADTEEKRWGIKKGTTNISVVVPLPKLKKIEKT
tara:strand:- start:213 stop:329 length:117 start_codon:yes stop_codon:yes gene_type:complete